MRTLVVAPSWVGDAVLSQPLIARLREADPGGAIDVLAAPWTLPVYRRMPQVAATIALPFRHGELAFVARRRLARTLSHYDRAVVLPNSWKSALVAWHAGIPVRTGYVGELRYGLLNDARRLDRAALPLLVERYAALAQPAGEALRVPLPPPVLAVDPAGRDATLAAFGLTLARPVAAFAPGAEYGPAKRWPAAHFAALARALAARGYQVWLLGSANDAAITAQIREASGGLCQDFAGRTSLDQAIDLLSCAARVVSNDSGLMHVAAALDRRTVALFGSSSPQYTPPLSAHARIVRLNLACSPCFARVCPLGHTDCLVKLAPELILDALD